MIKKCGINSLKIECQLFEVECEAYESKNVKLALKIEEVRKKLWEVIKLDLKEGKINERNKNTNS